MNWVSALCIEQDNMGMDDTGRHMLSDRAVLYTRSP